MGFLSAWQQPRMYSGVRVCRNEPSDNSTAARSRPGPRRARRTGPALFGDVITPETFLPRRAEAARVSSSRPLGMPGQPPALLPSASRAGAAPTMANSYFGETESSNYLELAGQAIHRIAWPIGWTCSPTLRARTGRRFAVASCSDPDLPPTNPPAPPHLPHLRCSFSCYGLSSTLSSGPLQRGLSCFFRRAGN